MTIQHLSARPRLSPQPALSISRQGLVFGEYAQQTGIEAGLAPSIFSLQVGLFDGAPYAGRSATGATKFKTVFLRGDAKIQSEGVNINVGGSFYNDPNPSPTEKATLYGGFGSLTVLNTLTLNGEFDYIHTPLAGSYYRLYSYTELNYMCANGIDLKLGYDF